MKTVLVLLISALPSICPAQIINAWTNTTSSYWEFQTNWSLGARPDQSQSVYITNAGFKAVAIGANTAQNFPASMQIQSLQIATPPDSFNVFLMNFSGFQVPLQTTSFALGANSSAVLQSSWLADSGSMLVQGTFNHGDFSKVTINGNLQIYDPTQNGPPGFYFLTNGTLTVDGGLYIGFGLGTMGYFFQYGGSNSVHNLSVGEEGEFDMYDGQLIATNGITVGTGDFATTASFYQYGGTISGDMLVNGNYILNGGVRTGNFSAAASGQRVDAHVIQTGGTNSAASMDVGHPNRFAGGIVYTLSNGVVHVDSSTTFGGGWFYQYNGSHTIVSNLVMEGRNVGVGNAYAEYFLSGGTLSVGGLTEQLAHFSQSGGSNLITGALVLSLTLPSQSTWYTLSGGTLSVKDIEIDANAFFQHTGGNIVQSGVLLLNQGEWRAANGEYSLGALQLGAPTSVIGFHTNSAIIFPDGSSVLRLANSSNQPWASNAILYITNWQGSISGGGATQLYFGSNSSGLSSQQLSQIRFAFSNSLSQARLLATGELVPLPTLQFSSSAGTMTLTWPSGSFLQSATNVAGPYNDVPGATSPRPVTMAKPKEFFRLRQ